MNFEESAAPDAYASFYQMNLSRPLLKVCISLWNPEKGPLEKKSLRKKVSAGSFFTVSCMWDRGVSVWSIKINKLLNFSR